MTPLLLLLRWSDEHAPLILPGVGFSLEDRCVVAAAAAVESHSLVAVAAAMEDRCVATVAVVATPVSAGHITVPLIALD